MIRVLNKIGNTKYEGSVIGIIDGWVTLKNQKVTFMFHTSNPAVEIRFIGKEWKKLL